MAILKGGNWNLVSGKSKGTPHSVLNTGPKWAEIAPAVSHNNPLAFQELDNIIIAALLSGDLHTLAQISKWLFFLATNFWTD